MSQNWGWTERFLVVFILMFLTVLSALALNEVMADADSQAVEAFSVGFQVLNLMVTYLIATLFTGWLVELLADVVRSRRYGDEGVHVIEASMNSLAAIIYVVTIGNIVVGSSFETPAYRVLLMGLAAFLTFHFVWRSVSAAWKLPHEWYPDSLREVVGR